MRVSWVALVLAVTLANVPRTQEHDTVWVWNARCARQTVIAIRVHLDRALVYSDSIPLCRWERRFEGGSLSFQLKPRRPLVWYGYRSEGTLSTPDPGDTTEANAWLRINLWQAGAEANGLYIGLTAEATDGLHMNTVHWVSPTVLSTDTIAPGLVLETRPVRRSASRQM